MAFLLRQDRKEGALVRQTERLWSRIVDDNESVTEAPVRSDEFTDWRVANRDSLDGIWENTSGTGQNVQGKR
jgi:hypothetical protein